MKEKEKKTETEMRKRNKILIFLYWVREQLRNGSIKMWISKFRKLELFRPQFKWWWSYPLRYITIYTDTHALLFLAHLRAPNYLYIRVSIFGFEFFLFCNFQCTFTNNYWLHITKIESGCYNLNWRLTKERTRQTNYYHCRRANLYINK